MKIERLMYILVTLLSQKYLKAGDIAEMYHVSIRTIYRDIDTLSLAGIPIYSKQGNEGGFYIDEDYQLNSLLFSDMEKKAIYELSQSLASSYQHPKIEELSQKMSYLVQKNQSQSPYFFDLSLWKNKALFLDDIEKAIDNKQVLLFEYTAYNGDTTKRKVNPINLVCKIHVWYLYGYCQLRNDFRLFRINRLRKVEILAETFAGIDYKSIEKVDLEKFYSDLGQRVKMIPVSLLFDKSVKARVYDTFSESDITEVTDKFLVEKEMPMENWLIELLLGFGGTVKVLAPDYLQKEIIQNAKNILEQYDIM